MRIDGGRDLGTPRSTRPSEELSGHQLDDICRRYFDEHVDPVLGREPIDAIGTKRVSDLIAALRVKPRARNGKPTGATLGTETIRRTLTMLQGVFTLAIQEELIHANPVGLVGKPDKPVPKAVKPLTVEQVERLRLHFLQRDDLWSMLYVVVLAYGGLWRRSSAWRSCRRCSSSRQTWTSPSSTPESSSAMSIPTRGRR